MTAAKKKQADPHLAQAEETLDLLKRIQEWAARRTGSELPWALEVRLEEEIAALEERVDLWGQP